MCVIVFVSATIFNVQIAPTFCEQYPIKVKIVNMLCLTKTYKLHNN